MDPLAAAGLAGNIVQFVHFTTEILSGARKLYKSASGAIEENQELENLTRNLRELAEKTQYNVSSGRHKHRSTDDIEHDEILKDISQQCIKVADELIAVLQSLKVRGDHQVWESAHQALRNVWKQGKIDSLQGRLDRISGQLNDRVSTQLQRQIKSKVHEMAAENARLEGNRTKEIGQLMRDFTAASEGIKRDVYEEGERTRAWLQISVNALKGQGYSAEQFILQNLRFYTMDHRHDSISKEHAKTFTWIFEEHLSTTADRPSVRFVDWLKREDGLYWVSGKPGSGKSTLMKFLAAHETTVEHLKEWCGDQKLIVASFFFWSAGKDPLQKSQTGLLRSILYQILRQCPELIQVAFHDQWRVFMSDVQLSGRSPLDFVSTRELLAAFQRISSSLISSRIKFCFFIDGLDEYEGRPSDIIQLVEVLKCAPNVKACVSSRPWNEFEASFGQNNTFKVYVHELTRDDIRLYVKDVLEKDANFRELKETDDGCPDLVEDVVSAAQGVFLWVFLVVRSLLDGLTNYDRITDLQKRLREIPTTLEEYFESILFTVDERYRQQTAHAFIVTLEADTTLPLMIYWFMDQDDPEYVFKMEVESLPLQTAQFRIKQMEKRLNARCKGMLEFAVRHFYNPPTYGELLVDQEVGFLHRTVRDFLRTANMQRLLHGWSADDFNVDLEICKAAIALFKIVQMLGNRHSSDPVWRLVRAFFVHVRPLDQDPSCLAVEVSLMDDLLRSIRANVPVSLRSYERSLRPGLDIFDVELKAKPRDADMIIMLKCIESGLTSYIASKLTEQPLLCREESIIFLNAALKRKYEYGHLNIQMLQLLLNGGADPNKSYASGSPWTNYVARLYDDNVIARESKPLDSHYKAIKMLLKHGAAAEEICDLNGGMTMLATEILRAVLSEDEFATLQDLIDDQKKKRLASTATSKNASTATSKNASTATSENASTATSKNASTATSENVSTATSKNASTATSENVSTATSKNASTATSENVSTATSKNASTATSENVSTATSKNASTATSKNASTATSKNASTATSENVVGKPAGFQSKLRGLTCFGASRRSKG